MSTPASIEVSGFETMADSMEFADNYNGWILSQFRPYLGRSLLEIGTGQGNFKKYLSQHVDTYVSVDIDPQVIERAKQRDPDGHYEIADVTDSNVLQLRDRWAFDSVICINVLEHVPDHQTGMRHLIELLQPGGHLLLFVPAFEHLFNDLDRLAGHLRRYRRRDIESMTAGMKNVELRVCEYFNPVGALGWFANKFKKHTRINSAGVNRQVMFFDRVLVPVSRTLNPITKGWWGQSLYCVLRKK
jgi:SAM-dependent methyltransferase